MKQIDSETMDRLERLSNDENLAVEFFVRYYEEVMSDEEPCYKKFRRLYEAYKKDPELTNEILMTFSGWTMETLAGMALGESN